MTPSSLTDTICAISTPIGEGGIGIVRLSGPQSIRLVSALFHGSGKTDLLDVPSHSIHHGILSDPETGEAVDEVLVSVMRSPKTFTREDTVEINAHGSPTVLYRILTLVLARGCRLAEPGEFTKRAFLNGRLDLTAAEAVMDLIQAKTDASSRAALRRLQGGLGREIRSLRDKLSDLLALAEANIDFPEEDVDSYPRSESTEALRAVIGRITRLLDSSEEGRMLREGLRTVIVGRPNAGKSSLLNALLEQDRAIVTPIPGTTRDVLEAVLNIQGIPIRIMDTAGLRETGDLIEKEGMRRTLAAVEESDLLLIVMDGQAGMAAFEESFVNNQLGKKKIILIINKIDIAPEAAGPIMARLEKPVAAIPLSAKQGDGLDALRDALGKIARSNHDAEADGPLVAHVRHATALEAAKGHLEEAIIALNSGYSEDLIAVDLRGALDRLGEIIGETTTEEILGRIFQSFCIGK
jgi:tRNA modification GTPase